MPEKLLQQNNHIHGTVSDGVGEGAGFMRIYRERFGDKLGIDPYLGTLNMIAQTKKAHLFLRGRKPVRILGFTLNGKNYGWVDCYSVRTWKAGRLKRLSGRGSSWIRVTQRGVRGYLIVPEKGEREKGQIEIISRFNLRKKLNVRNGDKIEIQ